MKFCGVGNGGVTVPGKFKSIEFENRLSVNTKVRQHPCYTGSFVTQEVHQVNFG